MPSRSVGVQEAARKSMNSKPLHFASRELMLSYAKEFCMKRFGADISAMLSQSMIIKNIKEQKKLTAFLEN